MSPNQPEKTIDEIKQLLLRVASEYYFEGSMGETWEQNKDVLEPALAALSAMVETAVGKPIELRADVDDELLSYVPDINERSVDGVSPSFTNLYTRAIVRSTQEAIIAKLIAKGFNLNKEDKQMEELTKAKVIEVLEAKRKQYAGNPDVPAVYLIAEIESELGLN